MNLQYQSQWLRRILKLFNWHKIFLFDSMFVGVTEGTLKIQIYSFYLKKTILGAITAEVLIVFNFKGVKDPLFKRNR